MQGIENLSNAELTGTSDEGRQNIIQRDCQPGMTVCLIREPDNPHDPNPVGAWLDFGRSMKQIGYIKAGTAKHLAMRIDNGDTVSAYAHSMFAPPGYGSPRVTISYYFE